MADSPEPPGMQQDLPKDGSLEMFLPDCDILIHLKMKVQFFLESTPEIRGGTVEAIVLQGSQKEKVVSSFSFWVLGENFPVLCQLGSVSIEAT